MTPDCRSILKRASALPGSALLPCPSGFGRVSGQEVWPSRPIRMISAGSYKKPSFDPRRELSAVARIATLSNALAVRSDRGINSVSDLVAYLKSNPKQAL